MTVIKKFQVFFISAIHKFLVNFNRKLLRKNRKIHHLFSFITSGKFIIRS